MYVDVQKTKRGKNTYRRALLRTSYREGRRVLHRTIANLSQCDDEEIAAIRWALKNKQEITESAALAGKLELKQGQSAGGVWTLYKLAERLGLLRALGESREAKLSLLMVMASMFGHHSRFSMVRNANKYAFCDILNLDAFDEDDLYSAMNWLEENQADIETKLFKYRYPKAKPILYLYDVTSSYLEGEHNELGAYGYNRDRKKGKQQIVIGLLTDDDGCPVSVQVFKGNTVDHSTFLEQIKKLKEQLGLEKVVTVGDRGMIKSAQIKALNEEKLNYITAITKPQIETMLKEEDIQLYMFAENLMEVEIDDIRYILKRNPVRAVELEANRKSKLNVVIRLVKDQNKYLAEHPRARPEVAVRKVMAKIEKLKLKKWLDIHADDRCLELKVDEEKKRDEARLDGCYAIKTDLTKEEASKEIVHDRYKDLAKVEWAFRSMKSTFLQMRGIYVRKAERTRAHVFVVMLSYMLAFNLYKYWQKLEVTVEEGVAELASICSMTVSRPGQPEIRIIPTPRKLGRLLLEAARVTLPDVIPCRNVLVATRKKLVPERKIAI